MNYFMQALDCNISARSGFDMGQGSAEIGELKEGFCYPSGKVVNVLNPLNDPIKSNGFFLASSIQSADGEEEVFYVSIVL